MPRDRSILRNITFCDGDKPDEVLGGFRQNGSITEANFLNISGIVLVLRSAIIVQERTSRKFVLRRDVPIESGVYDIFSPGMKIPKFLLFYQMLN